MKNKLQYIGNNMKSYRARIGLTQEKVAELLGISRVQYCDYEVNPQNVRIELYERLANILNCKLSDFFVEPDVTNSNIRKQSED